MMKPAWFAVLAGLMMLTSTAQASVSSTEFVLNKGDGAVFVGLSGRDDVVSMLGKPQKETLVKRGIRQELPGGMYRMTYGKNLMVDYWSYDTYSLSNVLSIVIAEDRGIATTEGIKVGIPVSQLLEKYGRPDALLGKGKTISGKSITSADLDAFSKGGYTALYQEENSGSRQMYFSADNGIVSQIQMVDTRE